ncbi:MAG: DUF4381 domain-containing protein [Pseudomonadales bacterium]|nr:DUF4381 domain-containing protein [Pseudomonadales bacterium]
MNNHQDIIHKLRDIHLPEPAGIFPLQPVWWIIIGLFSALLLSATYYFFYHRKKQQRLALKKLKKIEKRFAQGEGGGICMMETGLLLKNYAILQFPQTQLAHLWGEGWLEFLLSTSTEEQFEGEQGYAITQWPYQKEPSRTEIPTLINSVRAWFKENPHRSYRRINFRRVDV